MRSIKGFTLIELLVSISIIAVLATIGSTIFTNVQNEAKNSARKADIVAIAKAMESNYDPVTGTYNTSKILDGSAFASGSIPVPPEGGSYFGDLTSDSKGFRICATLSDSSSFCIDSEQGIYNENPPQAPYLMGTPPGSPTPTSGPTNTPTPTNPPGPTNTPTPTIPGPTNTPTPTTPPPPTSTPTPTTPPPPTPTPTPTNPPAGFTRVFITAGPTASGNLGGLSGADSICQTRAITAGLGGTWRAWLSSDTTPASSRIPNNATPYQLLNGTIIANNWTDLTDGTIDNLINRDENNVAVGAVYVWTGTLSSGASFVGTNCSNWTSTAVSGRLGNSGSLTSTWTDHGNSSCAASIRRLYCFEVGP